ncbi:MAG: sigma-70 family RNA polymerase sigma factor [Clostridia bacterium]|nr:sigma-70 family RNA polymerase sigma factor [Clostridia bacterium]
MRQGEEIIAAYERHADMVYRIAYVYLKNKADTEDAVQNTFLKLMERRGAQFNSTEHEKAWLIVTVSNHCRNELRRRRKSLVSLKEELVVAPEDKGEHIAVLEAIMSLPDRCKTVIYLHYYEGYKTEEIARMLHRPGSTVRSQLSEGRRWLRNKLGDDFLQN